MRFKNAFDAALICSMSMARSGCAAGAEWQKRSGMQRHASVTLRPWRSGRDAPSAEGGSRPRHGWSAAVRVGVMRATSSGDRSLGAQIMALPVTILLAIDRMHERRSHPQCARRWTQAHRRAAVGRAVRQDRQLPQDRVGIRYVFRVTRTWSTLNRPVCWKPIQNLTAPNCRARARAQ